jgi:hypothetical protein
MSKNTHVIEGKMDLNIALNSFLRLLSQVKLKKAVSFLDIEVGTIYISYRRYGDTL